MYTPPEGYITDEFDLKEQFNGQNNNRDELFLNHFPHGNHRTNYFTSLVKSDWKIIYHYPVDGVPRYEMFNLSEDSFETHNLANENPEQLRIMMKVLINEMNDKNALYPEKEGQFLGLIMPQ